MIPWLLPGQEFGELRLEYAEFAAPPIAQDPGLKPAFGLVIPPGGTERLKAADLGLDVVGLHVQVHSLPGGLLVAGLLQEDPDLRVRQAQPTVDGAAQLGQTFLGGVERGRPEPHAAVKVGDIDDQVAQAAAVHGR